MTQKYFRKKHWPQKHSAKGAAMRFTVPHAQSTDVARLRFDSRAGLPRSSSLIIFAEGAQARSTNERKAGRLPFEIVPDAVILAVILLCSIALIAPLFILPMRSFHDVASCRFIKDAYPLANGIQTTQRFRVDEPERLHKGSGCEREPYRLFPRSVRSGEAFIP
jgi:hypothetical protein